MFVGLYIHVFILNMYIIYEWMFVDVFIYVRKAKAATYNKLGLGNLFVSHGNFYLVGCFNIVFLMSSQMGNILVGGIPYYLYISGLRYTYYIVSLCTF